MLDKRWEALHAQRQWGVWPNEHLVRFVMRTFGNDRGAAFLDLGAGAGASARFLLTEKFRVTAVEGAQSAVNRLREWPGLIDCALGRILIADITRSEFNPGHGYDCVVDICTLQHLSFDDAMTVIRRARTAWLNPGGWFFSIMASPEWQAETDIAPRLTTGPQINDMFAAYKVRVGHELVQRASGNRVAHWIIEAQT